MTPTAKAKEVLLKRAIGRIVAPPAAHPLRFDPFAHYNDPDTEADILRRLGSWKK